MTTKSELDSRGTTLSIGCYCVLTNYSFNLATYSDAARQYAEVAPTDAFNTYCEGAEVTRTTVAKQSDRA